LQGHYSGEVEAQRRNKLGVFPSPRNPGLPGFRIIVRKSGRPDLRWGGVRGGGPEMWQRSCLIPTTPLPNPPPHSASKTRVNALMVGREHTERVEALIAHDRNML
jgi:hypothetical protein